MSSEATIDAPRRRNFFRRHLALTSLLILILLVIGAAGGFVLWINHQIGTIPRFNAGITAPSANGGGGGGGGNPPPDSGRPLNVLLLGADNGNGHLTLQNDLADGKWTPGAHRSDTIIIAHISANRQSIQMVSIPRDSWVRVDGFPGDIGGDAKINAAFSWGGPPLAVKTVQQVTGLHIDHVAIIDWTGFRDLSTALGGVRVYIPHTVYDDSQHVTWHQGWQNVEGERALQYVRMRHGLPNGDFDRIKRQQNFMRAVMDKLLSSGTTRNPIKLMHVVSAITSNLMVDDTWSNSEIRTLALQLRNLHSSEVKFTTAPFGSYDVVGGQDIVRLDAQKSKELFTDLGHGQLQRYLAKYPGSGLPSQTAIN